MNETSNTSTDRPHPRRATLRIATVMVLILSLASWARLTFSAADVKITVTTTDDENNNDGDCSLREAIIAANEDKVVDRCPAGAGADTIIVPPGTYEFALGGIGENLAASGDLDITESVQIVGAGKIITVVDASGLDRVFHIFVGSSGSVEISNLTVTGGNAGGDFGAGIFINTGTATLTNLRVGNNEDRSGINVFGSATAIIVNSRIHNNSTTASGGGMFNYGTIHLINSLVDENKGDQGGGGVWNQGTLLLVNSSVSGNSTELDGGGIANSGTVVLYNATIVENTADSNGTDSGDGGGVYNVAAGDFDFRNSIIGDNHDLSNAGSQIPDCSGTLFGYGYNLIENMTGCAIIGTAVGNVTGLSPGILPLAGNGGPTSTHALLAQSPAVDTGSPAGCASNIAGVDLIVDQRGFARPVDGDSDGDVRCDIGAFEYLSPGAPTPTPTPTSTPTNTSTPTRTPTATMTPTATSSPTITSTPTDGPSPTPTYAATPTTIPTDGPSSTPTATSTEGPSPTPTATATDGPSPTPTSTATDGPSPTPTVTETPGPSPTPFIPTHWLYLPAGFDN